MFCITVLFGVFKWLERTEIWAVRKTFVTDCISVPIHMLVLCVCII